jgi:hypothetical protein
LLFYELLNAWIWNYRWKIRICLYSVRDNVYLCCNSFAKNIFDIFQKSKTVEIKKLAYNSGSFV